MRKVLAVVLCPFLMTAAVDAGPDYNETVQKLNVMRISMDLSDISLPDVLDYLRDLTNLNFAVDSSVTDQEDLDEMLFTFKVQELNLKNALKLLLAQHDLTAIWQDGVLLVVGEEYKSATLVTEIYDARDLLFPIKDFPGPPLTLGNPDVVPDIIFEPDEVETITPEFITEMVKKHTGKDTWEDDGVALSLRENGMLIVTQSAGVHEEITFLLAKLRRFK